MDLAEAQTRGPGQGKAHSQGKGRAAERPAPRKAAVATTESKAAKRLKRKSSPPMRVGWSKCVRRTVLGKLGTLYQSCQNEER